MTEEERDDLIDLLPKDMILWPDEEELTWFSDRDSEKWMEILGHPRIHTACCGACGCAITCLMRLFHDSVMTSVVRELDKIGALRMPTKTEGES